MGEMLDGTGMGRPGRPGAQQQMMMQHGYPMQHGYAMQVRTSTVRRRFLRRLGGRRKCTCGVMGSQGRDRSGVARAHACWQPLLVALLQYRR
jgi:hypothetical protein